MNASPSQFSSEHSHFRTWILIKSDISRLCKPILPVFPSAEKNVRNFSVCLCELVLTVERTAALYQVKSPIRASHVYVGVFPVLFARARNNRWRKWTIHAALQLPRTPYKHPAPGEPLGRSRGAGESRHIEDRRQKVWSWDQRAKLGDGNR